MEAIKISRMPDETYIQIEDWSQDDSFYSKNSVIAAYPRAKKLANLMAAGCCKVVPSAVNFASSMKKKH